MAMPASRQSLAGFLDSDSREARASLSALLTCFRSSSGTLALAWMLSRSMSPHDLMEGSGGPGDDMVVVLHG